MSDRRIRENIGNSLRETQQAQSQAKKRGENVPRAILESIKPFDPFPNRRQVRTSQSLPSPINNDGLSSPSSINNDDLSSPPSVKYDDEFWTSLNNAASSSSPPDSFPLAQTPPITPPFQPRVEPDPDNPGNFLEAKEDDDVQPQRTARDQSAFRDGSNNRNIPASESIPPATQVAQAASESIPPAPPAQLDQTDSPFDLLVQEYDGSKELFGSPSEEYRRKILKKMIKASLVIDQIISTKKNNSYNERKNDIDISKYQKNDVNTIYFDLLKSIGYQENRKENLLYLPEDLIKFQDAKDTGKKLADFLLSNLTGKELEKFKQSRKQFRGGLKKTKKKRKSKRRKMSKRKRKSRKNKKRKKTRKY